VPLNSLGFLVAFAAFALLYYAVAPGARRWLLLGASLAFYATFNPWYLAPLLIVSIVAYAGARLVERAPSPPARRLATTVAVSAVLGVLVASKYLNFIASSIDGVTGGTASGPAVLARLEIVGAVGLSFYTFSAISYIVDVHREALPAARRFDEVALYLAYFPKLLAGPIERATSLLPSFAAPPRFDEGLAVAGLQQMLWGLFKKVVIADRLAVFVDRAYAQPQFASPADLTLATYAFAFQLYCDFSGYSDIAIGASRILGVELTENFRRPYLATTVAEFWARRWHLSLSTWFRDYVYIPLGGGRVSGLRRGLNVLIVFVLSGLWHGANWTFGVWGGLNGLYVVAGLGWRRWRDRRRPAGAADAPSLTVLRRVATFHLVLLTWVFFRAPTVADALAVLARIATDLTALPRLIAGRLLVGDLWLSMALVAFLVAVEALDERRPIWRRLSERPLALRWTAYYALGLALIVLGVWSRRQFVYMQF
jgi:D-alanyl-lipoteichoic acid acyltransferase DltB (MBOAT superfamily)